MNHDRQEVEMRYVPGIAIAVLAFAWGHAEGAGMSRQNYQAAKKRIAAQYAVERQKCGARYGNALDLCVAHAHGVRDVAKAELEAAYKPGARTNYDAAIARSKAAYTVAKEECDGQRGAQKTACVKDAKAALERARAEAKTAIAGVRADEAAKR